MTPRPISLSLNAAIDATNPIDPARLVAGTPKSGTLPAYEQAEAGFYAGQWVSEPGIWRVAYCEDELCIILEGSGSLNSEDGSVLAFKAGDAFVIPRGFKGQWETRERVSKIYAIAE